jgi:hypothetical protein
MLIYGEPGVGKTRLAATAQDHEDTSPMLLIDIEGGLTSIKNRDDIQVVTVRSFRDFIKLFNELVKEEHDFPFKTVAVDNMSELQELDKREIMEVAYNANPDRVDKDVPSQREWGKTAEHMRTITRHIRDLPCHTIMTAHVVTEKDEGMPTKHFPGFGGRAKRDVAGFVDIVGYMSVDLKNQQAVRRVQFLNTRMVVAKDRTDSLGDIVENPTIPLLWERIHTQES